MVVYVRTRCEKVLKAYNQKCQIIKIRKYARINNEKRHLEIRFNKEPRRK